MQPLISIIIPVYNGQEKLPFMIDSIEKQDYKNIELVIFNDASTDGTSQYLKELQASNCFEKLLILGDNEHHGVCYGRNFGLEKASGEYIVWLDHDDMLETNFLSSLYTSINSQNADYAACGYKRSFIKDNSIQKIPLNIPKDATAEDILIGRICNYYEISHWATLFRRDFLKKNKLCYFKGAREGAGEDIEFLIKMCACYGKGAFIPDCLYTYVQHDLMTSRNSMIDVNKKVRRYKEHSYAELREANYILRNVSSPKVKDIATYLIKANAFQRILSYYAMSGCKDRFNKLLNSQPLRNILLGSWRSIKYKPEIFFRSLVILILPNIYYKKYQQYRSK